MLLPLRPFVDPLAEHGDLPGREPRPFGGHLEIGIRGRDPGENFALRRRTGHDRPRAARKFADRAGPIVEPQTSFLRVGPVAGHASFGEQRLDIPRKIDRLWVGCDCGQGCKSGQQRDIPGNQSHLLAMLVVTQATHGHPFSIQRHLLS